MLSQNKIKFIQSLNKKKFRQKYNLFPVEGNKSIEEIVKSNYIIQELYATDTSNFQEAALISENDLKKISNLVTPQGSLALVEIPQPVAPGYSLNSILLDDIQDPGNFGTIIRTADWFGIPQIIVSENTVDLYNPKVIQASMGSFTRVHIIEQNLTDFCTEFTGKVYGADMKGESVYAIEKDYPFALIMGNEGNGLSPDLQEKSKTISIPNYSKNKEAESLNVGIATAVIVSEFIGNPL